MTDRPDRPQSIPVIVTDPPDVQHERAPVVRLDPWREAVVAAVLDAKGDPLRALAVTFIERMARIGLTNLPNHVVQLLSDGVTLATGYLAVTDGEDGDG